MMNIDSAMEN